MSSTEQLAKSEQRHPLQRCEHYLPGLESKPWWDGSELSFVQTLESNAETSSGDVLRAMSEDDVMPIRNKALMLRHCGIQLIESAADYALAALESPAYPGGEQAMDAVTDQTSVWLSLARLFSAGSGNEFGFTDAKDVIHLCGIYRRSKKRNLLAMYEFDEQWAAQERSALLGKPIGLRSPLRMMSFLASPQQTYNQLPVGDGIPLLVAALRELGCGRSN